MQKPALQYNFLNYNESYTKGVCRIPCVNCGGAGHKDCWNCNGDGVVKNTRTHYAHQDGTSGPQSMERCVTEACSICGGRGRETYS